MLLGLVHAQPWCRHEPPLQFQLGGGAPQPGMHPCAGRVRGVGVASGPARVRSLVTRQIGGYTLSIRARILQLKLGSVLVVVSSLENAFTERS